MKAEQIIETLADLNPDAVLADGLDDALIGVTTVDGSTVAVYSVSQIVGVLQRRDGMTGEQAREFYEFNIDVPVPGDFAPVFVEDFQ